MAWHREAFYHRRRSYTSGQLCGVRWVSDSQRHVAVDVGVQDLCLSLGENLAVVGLIATKSVLAHVSESDHGLVAPVEKLKVSNPLEVRVVGPWAHGKLERSLDNLVETGLLEVSLPANGLLARDVALLCNLKVELANLGEGRVLWKGTVVRAVVGNEARDFKVGAGLEGAVDLLDEVGPVVDRHGQLTGVDEIKDVLSPAPVDLHVVDLDQVSMRRASKGLGLVGQRTLKRTLGGTILVWSGKRSTPMIRAVG